MLGRLAVLLLAPLTALALPGGSLVTLNSIRAGPGCDVSNVKIPVIAGITVPAGEKPTLITVGRGVQNYTCTNGAYVAAGALANLYDVGCLYHFFDPAALNDLIPQVAYAVLDYPDSLSLPVKVDHYFSRKADGGIAPVFATKTGSSVTAAVAERVNAPQDPANNVPWLRLTATSGTLAKSVYRLGTDDGQPPASCSTEGQQLSVQYAATYIFAL